VRPSASKEEHDMTDMQTTKNGQARLAIDADGVATITMHMDGRANKLDDSFAQALEQGLHWAKAQPSLKGIILASGHKDFCVGADIDRLYRERDAKSLWDRLQQLHALYRAYEQAGVPVVAALTGSALGGGYELALACHRRIAVDDPRIQLGLPEVNLGVIPGAGGTQRLTRVIGKAKAMDLVLTGRMMKVEEAERAGLVARIVPLADLKSEAMKLAETIAGMSLPATMLAKESVNRAYETTLAEGIRFERRVFQSIFGTADQKEGMNAFNSKRAPDFKHR
jgi:enoyl-CoA hydratase